MKKLLTTLVMFAAMLVFFTVLAVQSGPIGLIAGVLFLIVVGVAFGKEKTENKY